MTNPLYIAVDVEASGPTPANYSFLSIGASVVGQSDRTFYREMKPINQGFIKEAMKVGCLGLRCLDDLREQDERYNPQSDAFRPDLVLDVLEDKGTEPSETMSQFGKWINKSSDGKRPILASDCDAFDGMFVHFYFDKFSVDNPFVYGGVNIDSMYRGIVRDSSAQIEGSEFWSETLSHNAMEDAVVQAKALEGMLSRMTVGKSNNAEKVEIYEAIWDRYREDSRISTKSKGLYPNHRSASRALAEVKRRQDYVPESARVVSRTAIKIGDKIYERQFEYQIPRTFADPLRLEEVTESSVDLELGDGCIVTIRTKPLQPTRFNSKNLDKK